MIPEKFVENLCNAEKKVYWRNTMPSGITGKQEICGICGKQFKILALHMTKAHSGRTRARAGTTPNVGEEARLADEASTMTKTRAALLMKAKEHEDKARELRRMADAVVCLF